MGNLIWLHWPREWLKSAKSSARLPTHPPTHPPTSLSHLPTQLHTWAARIKSWHTFQTDWYNESNQRSPTVKYLWQGGHQQRHVSVGRKKKIRSNVRKCVSYYATSQIRYLLVQDIRCRWDAGAAAAGARVAYFHLFPSFTLLSFRMISEFHWHSWQAGFPLQTGCKFPLFHLVLLQHDLRTPQQGLSNKIIF